MYCECIWATVWGRQIYSVEYPAGCALTGHGSMGEPIAAYLLSPPDLTLENSCCWRLLPSISRIRWSNFGLFQWCITCNRSFRKRWERADSGHTGPCGMGIPWRGIGWHSSKRKTITVRGSQVNLRKPNFLMGYLSLDVPCNIHTEIKM